MWTVDAFRFAFVAACALAVFFLRGDKWLLAGMALTVMADACLLLLGWHTTGVAVFVFAHISYICRASGSIRGLKWYPLAFIMPLVLLLCKQPMLLVLSALYAQSLLWAAAASIRAWRAQKQPVWRWRLAALGMVLFIGCDICVALYNLESAGLQNAALSKAAGQLIWFFYAPSQLCLALSAWRGRRSNKA